jgi:hypothetical protein
VNKSNKNLIINLTSNANFIELNEIMEDGNNFINFLDKPNRIDFSKSNSGAGSMYGGMSSFNSQFK